MLVVPEEEKLLKSFDRELHSHQSFFNLLKILTPTNMQTEQDRFIAAKWEYNPQFTYNFPDDEAMECIAKFLEETQVKYTATKNFKSAIAKLLREKVEEFQTIYLLIQAYKEQNFTNILTYNEKLFGSIDSEQVKVSEQMVSERVVSKHIVSPISSRQEVISYLHTYLNDHNLQEVQLQEHPELPYRISVAYTTKNIILRLGRFDSLSQEDLDAIVAHEIQTHIQRYLAGKKSWRELLKLGTAGNVVEEEWLAVYQSIQVHRRYNPAYIHSAMYSKYLISYYAQSHDFIQTVKYIQSIGPSKSLISIFKATIRSKMGIQDTSQSTDWAFFARDRTFLIGYNHINERVEKWWDIQKLFNGKTRVLESWVFD